MKPCNNNIVALPESLLLACLNYRPNARSMKNGIPITGGGLFRSGRRNTDMASVAGSLRKRGASEPQIESLLIAINSTLPNRLPENEVLGIAHSISRYDVLPVDFSHDGIAKFFCESSCDKIRYCIGNGFYVYDGKRWTRDTDGVKTLSLFRAISDKINSDIAVLLPKMEADKAEKLKKSGERLRNETFMRSVLRLSKADELIQMQFDGFDANKNLINLANGTYDLRTKSLREHSATDHLTHLLPIEFDIQADCPAFKKLLADVLQTDKSEFLMRVFGYALQGTAKEQMFFILHGRGKNGKSTLLNAITDVLGELAVNVQPETLNGKMDGSIRNDLAGLPGKRLMTTSETRSGTLLDAPLLKQLTGLDTLSVRFLHHEYFEFQPVCVPIITSNFLPVVDGSDFAMERRVCLISFDFQITVADRELPQKLKAEKAGIFNLLLQGLADYEKQGLSVPASVSERTKAFIERSNLLRGFYQEKLEPNSGGKLKAGILYNEYVRWCMENGYRPMSQNIFKDSFEREINCEQARNSEGRYWPGIRLRR